MIENDKVDNLYLVYSEKTENHNGTKDIAARIRDKLLELKSDIDIKYVSIRNIYNPGYTIDLPDYTTSPCHLDITGGSKVMSYVVKKELEENNNDLLVSYLDPQNQRINFSDNTSASLLEYGLSLKKLMDLHDLDYKVQPKIPTENDFKIVDEVLRIFGSNEYAKYNRNFKSYFKLIDSKKQKDSKLFMDELTEFQKKKSLTIDYLEPLFPSIKLRFDSIPSNREIELIKSKSKMFEGGWFEIYIYKIIEELLEENLPDGYYCELKTSVEIINKNAKKEFEIDVIVIINHKLFGISLTTSTMTSVNKSKVFEIVYRAKQIGGDEANSVFITTKDFNKKNDSFTKFKRDLINDLNFDRKVLIESFPNPLKNRDIYKRRLKDYIFDK